MSIPEPLNPIIPSARRLARKFTPNTPFHHPHLDPKLSPEDLHLVPAALFPGRKLNWELPRLTNNPDELAKKFHDKTPQIDDILGLWGEMKGASPTTTGEAQLRARIPVAEDHSWTSTEKCEGTAVNLVSKLDTRGQTDVIYLADAVEDSGEHAGDSSVPSNLRTMDWSGFDGSYVHLEDVEPKMTVYPTEQGFDFGEQSMRRNSTPSNLRATEWLDDELYREFASDVNPEPGSDAGRTSRQTGPYETFWMNHDPYGPQLALNTDEGESNNSTSH